MHRYRFVAAMAAPVMLALLTTGCAWFEPSPVPPAEAAKSTVIFGKKPARPSADATQPDAGARP